MCSNDVKFSDKNEKEILIKSNTNLKRVFTTMARFHFQKNRQNGQQIRLVADSKRAKACSAINLAEMVKRCRRLSHPMDLPFNIYANKNGDIKYLTGPKLTEVIRGQL